MSFDIVAKHAFLFSCLTIMNFFFWSWQFAEVIEYFSQWSLNLRLPRSYRCAKTCAFEICKRKGQNSMQWKKVIVAETDIVFLN